MKKYLMTGVAALAMCAAFTSCSHEEIEQLSQDQIEKNKYESVFIQRFGKPAANQDWGYSKFSRNATRSTEKETHTLAQWGLTKPTLKDGEAEHVMNYFRTTEGENSKGLDITSFFIVFVGGNTTVNVKHHDWEGNYYNNNKNNAENPATSNFFDVYSTETSILDYLVIDGEHIYDWNANGGVTELVYDRKADNFVAHNSYCDVTTTKWKLAKITYQGEEGWYVGISSYAKKSEGFYTKLPEGAEGYDANDKDERAIYTDYDRENFYDDYVFKIVPADIMPAADVRIIAEDLTIDENGDFDFNDVVFDVVYDYDNSQSAIILRAAGGTLPLYVDGHEVHEEFGVGRTTMVNTGRGASKSPKLIKLGRKINHGLDLEIKVEKPSGTLVLDAVAARAPHKIAVAPNFDWCSEKDDIEITYPNFAAWVKDPSVSWY